MSVGVTAGTSDITAAWSTNVGPLVVPFAVVVEDASPPVVEPPVVVNPPVTPPTGDGSLVGEIHDGKIVLFASQALELAGLDIVSVGGNLVPVEGDAAPFSFFLSNTANQITWGNQESTVRIEGEFATNAGYVGVDPVGDLTAAWGDGLTPVAFPIRAATPPVGNETIPEPTTGLLSVFAVLGVLGFRRRSC